MALTNIPTGILPEEVVNTLPSVGAENKVYRRLVEDPMLREMEITDDFIWYDGEWHPFSFDVKIYGAYFAKYQASVEKTIETMEQTIAQQAQMIEELEEAVFPTKLVSFEMLITSLVMTELDLVDADGNVVEANALSTEIWESEELVFQSTLKAGTYYLRNNDGYALGKPNGDIQPLVADGSDVVNLGSVEIVMIGGVK